jgi:preprotein translocase subunit SecF
MWVVKLRKYWYILSAILFAVSIYGMLSYGFNLSIDFKGGTITEVKYEGNFPPKDQIETALNTLDIGGYSVRPSGSDRYIIRTRELSGPEAVRLSETLLSISSTRYTIERQNTIGPIAGESLKNKAMVAVLVVVLMIVLFITFAFRKVSKPVASWKYGLATIIALVHDVIIPAGVFVFLGHFLGIEMDLLFVSGLLAILGYSVHDSIVVFDRVRENLSINKEKNVNEEFETTVGRSVSQTFGRSINTSVTIFITLLALYIWGPGATSDFSLLLLIGVVAGTYSSIFIASPLLVTFDKLARK